MYINLSGQPLYFQKVGHGQNLIILHGWGNDVSSFWPLLDWLKSDFTVWLVDLPGFGRSSLPKTAFSVADYAEVIKEFIKQNKIKNPHLLGHSLGGRIAIKLAAKYPDLLNKLILEACAGIKPKQDNIKPFIYLVSKLSKYLLPNIFNLKTKLRYKFYRSLEADYISAGKLAPTLTKILAEDLTLDLPKIKNETLVIWGELDKAVPLQFGKIIYQNILNARLEVFEDTGHFSHLENPQMFSYYLKDFLE